MMLNFLLTSIVMDNAFIARPNNATDGPSTGGTDIQESRKAISERMGKEHSGVQNGTGGVLAADGLHLKGSAVAYLQAAAPTLRPDGATTLNASDDGRVWVDSDNYETYVYKHGTGWVLMSSANASIFFHAYTVIAGTPVTWATIVSDTRSCYSAATGRFTCPVAGLYEIVLSFGTYLHDGGDRGLIIRKNGASVAGNAGEYHGKLNTINYVFASATFVWKIVCAVSDYIDILATGRLNAIQITKIGNTP